MAYDTTEERLKVRGSEQITRDLKVNRDAFINGNLDTKNLEIEGGLSVGGEAVFADDIAVHGDLYVTGTTTTTSEAQVSSSGNYIVTRDNNNSPMGIGQYSGLAVNNYATGKIATITSDNEGTWRISDSATSTATTFTNISAYNGVYYSGLTQTTTTGPSGILTGVDADELASVVLNGTDYYHHSGNDWFGPITLVSNSLDTGAVVTDATLIATLNGLTKNDLVYYRSVISKSIDASTNQPLLTRSESSGLVNNDILVWDSTEEKAVDSGSKISDLVPKTTTVNGHALSSDVTLTASDVGAATSADITNAINTLDVTDSAVAGEYVSSVSETNGIISVTRDSLANLAVSGVKGNAESSYRRGNVNLTPADIGAVNKAGDTVTGSINRDSGGDWISGRDNAVVRQLRANPEGSSWNPVIGVKTQAGNWTMGSVGGEKLQLSYDTDANYAVHNNEAGVIDFPSAGSTGTLALTSQIPTANSQLTNDSGYLTVNDTINNAVTAQQVVLNSQNVVQYKATSFSGYTIQDSQTNALYVEGRETDSGDSGGLAITNDAVNVFGAGDTDGVLRVINEDNVAAGPVFKVMKDGQTYATGRMHGTVDNADTVDGYHASEGSYGSTVAARDANGYLNANIFHDSWATENINSYSSPTVMFKGNGDGYLRSTSLNDLKTALNIEARVNADWNAASGPAEILNKPSFALDNTTGIKNFYVETDNQYAKCSVGRALSYISKRAPVVGTEDYWAAFINKVFGGFNSAKDATIYSPTVTGTLLIPGESTARNLRNSKLQFTQVSSGIYPTWTLYIDNVVVFSERSTSIEPSKWTYDLYISGGPDDTYFKRRFNVTATIDHFEDENGNTIDPATTRIYRGRTANFNVIYNLSSSIPQDMNTTNMSIGILIPNSAVYVSDNYIYDLKNNIFRTALTSSTGNFSDVLPQIDVYYNANNYVDSTTPNAFNIIAPFVLLSNNSAKVSVTANPFQTEYDLKLLTDQLGSETLTVTEYYS